MAPLIVLPNDELIIRYGVGECDADINHSVLEKFDTAGQSVWHIFFPEYEYPEEVWLTPDSNLLLRIYDTIFKISSLTGETIWEYDFPFPPIYESSFIFVPGSEDLLLGDKEGIKYFRQMKTGDTISYELFHSYDMAQVTGYFKILGTDGHGLFYGIKLDSTQVFRFRADLQPALVLKAPTWIKESSFFPGYFALGLGYVDLDIRLYDTLGQLLKIWQPTTEGLSIRKINLVSDGFAVAGDYLSGRTADAYPDPPIYKFGREQGWFRFYPDLDFTYSKQQNSLSIRDIIQVEPVGVDSTYVMLQDYEGYIFKLTGGIFSIRIQNTGSEPVHSFAINSMINLIPIDYICHFDNPNYTDFKGYDILPGESIWVEYSGLEGWTIFPPPHFCFWTSAPNERPDDIPGDDMYCMERTISTNETDATVISLYPNPANSTIWISGLADVSSSNRYQLIDVFGRIIRKGQLHNNSGRATIDISDISSGIYYLNTDNYSKMIVIQH